MRLVCSFAFRLIIFFLLIEDFALQKFLIPKAEYSQVVSAMNHHLELPLTFERCSSQRLKLVSFSCQNKVSQTMG